MDTILIRQHLPPKLFQPNDLWELDAAEYEELEGVQHEHTRAHTGTSTLTFSANLFVSPDYVSLHNPLKSSLLFVYLKHVILMQAEDGFISVSCGIINDAENIG